MLANCSTLITYVRCEAVNGHVMNQSIDIMFSHTDIPTCAK